MSEGQKSNIYVVLLTLAFFYIAASFNACSPIDKEQISRQEKAINN